MKALRTSADVADVRLERKLWYEYANLKARGQLSIHTRYALAKPVDACYDPVVRSNSLPPITIVEKCYRSQDEPYRDAQKHPRSIGIPAEGVSYTLMSSSTPDTRATSPNTGIRHEDDVVSGVYPHGTGGSLDHRAASMVVVVPK